MPREARPGMEVISGCINQTGILTIRTTKEFGESTVAKILDLVENASDKKGQIENFITRFARYYTPVVVFAALALAALPPLITGQPFSTWLPGLDPSWLFPALVHWSFPFRLVSSAASAARPRSVFW